MPIVGGSGLNAARAASASGQYSALGTSKFPSLRGWSAGVREIETDASAPLTLLSGPGVKKRIGDVFRAKMDPTKSNNNSY